MNYHMEKRRAFLDALPDGGVVILYNDCLENGKCSRNFFYLTGIESPDCVYFAEKKDGAVHEVFFRPHDNPLRLHFDPLAPTPEEILSASGVTDVRYAEELAPLVAGTVPQARYLGFDLDPRRNESPMLHTRKLAADLIRDYPAVPVRNVFYDIKKQRLLKTPEEMAFVRRAMDVTERAIRRCMAECRPGMYEYELEASFYHEVNRSGLKIGFPSIVAAGDNTFSLHYHAARGRIADGDLVLLDVGAEENGYCVDISRVFPANGVFTDKQRAIYDAAYRANNAVRESIRMGTTSEQINATCRASVYESLRELGLVQTEAETGKYYWHRVSHHVGLDVHDTDCYDFVVEPGQMFTVDAGVYVTHPDWRIGLRLEDNVFIGEDGKPILLSPNIPRTVGDIERACPR